MRADKSYQVKHLQAIKGFYTNVTRQTQQQFSLTDVIIAWFTEGYAEKYRRKHLRHRTVATL